MARHIKVSPPTREAYTSGVRFSRVANALPDEQLTSPPLFSRPPTLSLAPRTSSILCSRPGPPTSKCISRPTTVRALLAWPLSNTAYLLRPSPLPFMRRLESRRWIPLLRPELPCKYDTCACTLSVIAAPLHPVGIAFRHSIVASIPRCHRGDPGSIPGGEVWRYGDMEV